MTIKTKENIKNVEKEKDLKQEDIHAFINERKNDYAKFKSIRNF